MKSLPPPPTCRVLVCLTAATLLGVTAVHAQDEGYEGGRGLISLEGPSGMFINPTSGTMPADAYTVQYCVFFPNNDTDVVGHGAIAAYGVSDDFEVGVQGTVLDIKGGNPGERGAAGPFARMRLTKDDGAMPQVSVGAYSRLGDSALNKGALFLAGYKRFPVDEDGLLRSLGLHAGIKELWLDAKASPSDSFSGYGGVEVQLPLRIYAVGEVTSKDSDANRHVPYAYGLQWRAPGIAMSVAGIQNGNTPDVAFYYGIGLGGSF